MEEPKFQPAKLAVLVASLNLFSDLLLYPLDTIATRLKTYKTQVSFLQEFRKIIKCEGLQSLYRGVQTSFPTSFVPSLVYFFLYENMNKIGKKYLWENGFKDKTYLLPMITATAAETGSLAFLLPFDIVRTRLQMNSVQYRYSSILDGLTKIQQKEGFLRVFKAS